MKKKTLTFDELREKNLRRCGEVFPRLESQSLNDLAMLAFANLGEACSYLVGMKKGEPITPGDIGEELADAVIFIDLLCSRLGIELGLYVWEKFNRISDIMGSEHYLEMV